VRTARFWPALGLPALLAALLLALTFVSPAIRPSMSAAAWAVFASAMLACCIGALYLISTALLRVRLLAARKPAAGLLQPAVVAHRRDLLHPGHLHHDGHRPLRGAVSPVRSGYRRPDRARLGVRGRSSGPARAPRRCRPQATVAGAHHRPHRSPD
jgi:hypothetical protein